MSHRKKQVVALAFLSFVVLWAVGLIRGPRPMVTASSEWSASSYDSGASRQQLANNLRVLGLVEMPLPAVLDRADIDRIQVHERTARLTNSTSAFVRDQLAIRSALNSQRAVVFNETDHGVAPTRRITLEIGVHPDRFEALVEDLRNVARLESISVQQRDRTGEFRRLHAQRQSLKKHLEAVQKLRTVMNPTIDDQLKLEQKVQDIEKELQNLGVQLGDFVGKDSYYHVHVTLSETGGRLDHAFALPLRICYAFLWALTWWTVAATSIFVVAASGVCLRVLVSRGVPRIAGESPTNQPA